MAQFARPDSDVSGAWDGTTGSNYYTEIDDATPVESSYINEDDGSTVEVGLSNVTDPAIHTGHTVRVWAYRSSNKANTLTAALFQGGTQIATNGGVTVTNGSPSQAYSFNLSEAEAANISDYTDLRLKLTAIGTNPTDVFVVNAELEVPTAATTHYGACDLNASAAIVATPQNKVVGAAALSASATIAAAAFCFLTGIAALSGSATIAATGTRTPLTRAGTASLSASATLAPTGTVTLGAPQTIRPDGAVDNPGSWSATGAATLWECIDDTGGGDGDTTRASRLVEDTSGTFEVHLEDAADPLREGSHVVHALVRQTASPGGADLEKVRLMEGATEIASWTDYGLLTTSYQLFSRELTQAQANAISDYSDLRLEFDGYWVLITSEIRITQAYVTLPSGPKAALAGSATITATGTVSAGAVEEGAADLDATATLTATASATKVGAASLTGSASLAPRAADTGRAALEASATLAAAPTVTFGGKTDLQGTATLSATGDVWNFASAALTAQATLQASGVVRRPGAAALAAQATLQARSADTARASLAGSAAIAAAPVATKAGAAALAGAATLTPAGTVIPGGATVTGSADLEASATLAVTGSATWAAKAALAGSATIAPAGVIADAAIAHLSASATLVAKPTIVGEIDGEAYLQARASLIASGVRTLSAKAALSASASLQAVAQGVSLGEVEFKGTGTVVAALRMTYAAQVSIQPQAFLVATGDAIAGASSRRLEADLVGSGAIIADLDMILDFGLDLVGSGSVTADLSVTRPAAAVLRGTARIRKAIGSGAWGAEKLTALGRKVGDGLVLVDEWDGNVLPIRVSAEAPSGAPPGGKGVVFQTNGSIWVWNGSAWIENSPVA